MQQLEEPVNEFFAVLHNLVKHCGYKNTRVEDLLVRNKFIMGLWDEKLSEQLRQCTKLSAKEALGQAHVHEEAKEEHLSRSCFHEIAPFDSDR